MTASEKKGVRKKKEKPVGQYRNLQLMPGRTDLWEFEVKRRDGSWTKLTNMGAETDAARKQFAQKTAERWIHR